LKLLAVRVRNRALRAAHTRGNRISRKPLLRIEHLFGEAKTCHGLGHARYRGLAKVQQQMLLAAVAFDLKRLAVSAGRRRAPANAVAKRVERGCPAPLSTLNHLRKSLIGMWAAVAGMSMVVLLGGMEVAVHLPALVHANGLDAH
jgi:hypothetical protein